MNCPAPSQRSLLRCGLLMALVGFAGTGAPSARGQSPTHSAWQPTGWWQTSGVQLLPSAPLPGSVGLTPAGLSGSTGPQFLPLETLYPSYLAGPKEPRLGTRYGWERDDGGLWDTTLGGRFGWLRGTSLDGRRVWQIDVEGAALVRLDPQQNIDLRSVDFRAGIPLAIAWGQHRLKLAYYHLSAHAGDEFLLSNPNFVRLNYVRDALVLGYARYWGERVRVYAEASWAFYADVSDPWQFQFGYEYAPTRPTGIAGAPFLAVNGLLREEVDFGGTATLHLGWAWRGARAGRLLRVGMFVQSGKSAQMEFYRESETLLGGGIWYDF